MERAHLLVIGDAVALAWVLSEGRMAFPEARRRQVEGLREGDELFIYTTRACFNNPSRDRGRIIGYAHASSSVAELRRPVTVGRRTFTFGCDLEIAGLAPLRSGVDLASLVHALEAFPNPDSWSARLRRPPVTLSSADANRIHEHLDPLVGPLSAHLAEYRDQAASAEL